MAAQLQNATNHDIEKLGKEAIDRLVWLGRFGKDPAGGVTRLLYSREWVEAQRALKQWMESEGFVARFDEVGNLSGILEGANADETILTGSHIDTVRNGGLYDGQYGIVAGMIAIKYLKDHFGKPKRNIEVISFAEEEGSRFPYTFWGSKNIIGKASRKEVERIHDADCISFIEAMKASGFTFRDESKPPRQDLKAFIEVHVEQGQVLEAEQKSIGIVYSIVGQRRFSIEITGEANHAGTTPMKYRKDAAYAGSHMIHEMIKLAEQYGDPLVATVGKITLIPNNVNVVPGKVVFSLDVRHPDKQAIVQFSDLFTEKIREISREHGVETSINMQLDTDPVPMTPQLVEMIENYCKLNKFSYKLMHSGAGHDAQMMAETIPTAMIFVPSRKGISHNPAEYTDYRDLGKGVKTLIGVLYELAY